MKCQLSDSYNRDICCNDDSICIFVYSNVGGVFANFIGLFLSYIILFIGIYLTIKQALCSWSGISGHMCTTLFIDLVNQTRKIFYFIKNHLEYTHLYQSSFRQILFMNRFLDSWELGPLRFWIQNLSVRLRFYGYWCHILSVSCSLLLVWFEFTKQDTSQLSYINKKKFIIKLHNVADEQDYDEEHHK